MHSKEERMLAGKSNAELAILQYYIDVRVQKRFVKLFEERAVNDILELPSSLDVYHFGANVLSVYDTSKDKDFPRVVSIELNNNKMFSDEKIFFDAVCNNGKRISFFSHDTKVCMKVLELFERFDSGASKIASGITHTVHFENEDIIITDPCYIFPENPYKQPKYSDYGLPDNFDYIDADEISNEYWKKYEAFKNDPYNAWERIYDKLIANDHTSEIFSNRFIVRNTIYGDWSCTVYDTDSKEKLGEFCADAGLVGVFALKDVLEFNKDFDYHKNRSWTTTLIKNFTGDVKFIVHEDHLVREEDTDFWKKGDHYEDIWVEVAGTGSVNFTTRQTGF